MKNIAAIDVGSNSIRAVIAQLRSDGTFEIIDQIKDMVRLAEGETPERGLTPRALQDGLLALEKASAICRAHQVDETIAVATSAVREAKNGASFIGLAKQRTGIEVNVITAEEEARLTYLGARQAIPLDERRALVIDIGGGSVEFIIGEGSALLFTTSAKLGVLRLLNQFPISDPVEPGQVEEIKRHIARLLDPILDQVHQIGFDVVIGTSGTNLTLFNLAFQRSSGNGAHVGSLNNKSVPMDKLAAVCEWLLGSSIAERRASRIQVERLNSIVMGAVLWRYLDLKLGTDQVLACRFALREGILVDFLQNNRPGLRQEEAGPDPRHRSVLGLAERCQTDMRHGGQVARLALSIFDQLECSRLGEHAREWLEYAALLHDCGYQIGAKKHHKHSHYLILHSDLVGFTPEEVRIIAAVARYHRRRCPTKGDRALKILKQWQTVVRTLAGILRIAEGLDRSHFGVVEQVQVTQRNGTVAMRLFTRGDAELERWSASHRRDLLEESLEKRIRVRLGGASVPKTSGSAPREGAVEPQRIREGYTLTSASRPN